MILLVQLSYIVGILLNTGLAFLVFAHGKKGESSRIFFVMTMLASSWLISLFLFYTVSSPTAVLWIGRFNFAVILPMLWYLLKFAIIFPRKTLTISPSFLKGFGAWIFVFTLLTLLTPLVDKNEIITASQGRTTEYGIAYTLYILHYIVFSTAILAILILKLKRSKEILERNQIEYIVVGLALALLFGFVTNILLYSTGAVQAAQYGPLAIVIFSGFVTTAILKHYLFDIKVLATQLFTAILVIFLFINLFFSRSASHLILNGGLFVGSLIFGYFLIRSVLQEIRLRQKLQRAYKDLKRLDEAKSEFISIASHQLRTPLTAIKGYISMLMENTYGKLKPKQKTPLQNVYKSNERLITLVNDLLSISRIESGKIKFEPKKTKLEEIISSVLEELQLKAKEKGLALAFKQPKLPLPSLFIDTTKIRNVIMNIVDNAIKYTQKGSITLSIATRPQNRNLGMTHIIISIADTGEGMTPEEITHLFESFTRGKAGTKYWTEGSGLGLYIAKQFILMHKGKIWAESAGKGKGSTFFIELLV